MYESIKEDEKVYVLTIKDQELLQCQIDLLNNRFGEQWQYYYVSSTNWTSEEQYILSKHLINCKVVITSDMPYFIALVAYNRGYKDGKGLADNDIMYILNEKKTKVISIDSLQQTEWELLLI